MTNEQLAPASEGEGDLSIDRLRELYQDARGAVLAGAVRCGANEFTGVSKDDAIDYAAAFLRVADQLFDRVGQSAVGTAAVRPRRGLTSPRGGRVMDLRRPEVGRVVQVRGRLLGGLGDSPGKVALHEGELASVTFTEEDDYLVVLGRCRDDARVVSCKLHEPVLVVESAAPGVHPATRRLQEVADLLVRVLGHQPDRSTWEYLYEAQRDLLADLIDESHRRYAQDVGMPGYYAPVDRWWRGGTGG